MPQGKPFRFLEFKMKKHINIPIFIPHLGCPNDCVFCNQRSISGKLSFDETLVKGEIEEALSTVSDNTDAEIAFFGGSFTGIDRGLMIRLLDTAESFVKEGKVSGIRLSTRPDYISREILEILLGYSVKTIELGIQSMDDRVLSASRRGHTARDSEKACRLIKEYGFSLVGQMMTGLPLSTHEAEIMTAEKICELSADGARIYPTMVFYNTELENMAKRGEYTPPELEDAISRTASVLGVFVKNNVPVIRIGLHSGETLYSEEGISLGAYHPAMGELVKGELYYRAEREALLPISSDIKNKKIMISVCKGELSKAIGQGRKNGERLISEFSLSGLSFSESEKVEKYSLRVYFA